MGRSSTFDQLVERIRAQQPVTLATVIASQVEDIVVGAKLLVDASGHIAGTLGTAGLDLVVGQDCDRVLDSAATIVRHYGPAGEAADDRVSVFVESFAPPPRLFVFGAIDAAASLASVARGLGFRVTVCDAREAFATSRRFPDADEVIVEWPHRLLQRTTPPLSRRDAVCVLTHDRKFDVPAIIEAFSTDVGYIGALGSRRTTADRAEALRNAGATPEQLQRLHAPIGLDLGARTPAEMAIAIVAEIIAHRNAHSAGSLRASTGPIHS